MIATSFTGDEEILKIILGCLKPNGMVVFLECSSEQTPDHSLEQLKLSGFQNATRTPEGGKWCCDSQV